MNSSCMSLPISPWTLVAAPLHSAITRTQSHTMPAKLQYGVNNDSYHKGLHRNFLFLGPQGPTYFIRCPFVRVTVRLIKGPSRQDNLIEYKHDRKNQVRLDTLPRWGSAYLVHSCKPVGSSSNGLNAKYHDRKWLVQYDPIYIIICLGERSGSGLLQCDRSLLSAFFLAVYSLHIAISPG